MGKILYGKFVMPSWPRTTLAGVTVVWAVGDGATGGTDAAAVAAMIVADKPDAFLWLGDVYETGTAGEFAANYKPSWGQLDSICYPIPGNHDFGNYASGYKPYFDAAERPSTPYYSFALGEWEFLMLNSEEPMDATSTQYHVAQAALGTPTDRKRIACWHRPRYCSGSHGDATDTDPLWQLVGPHCVAVLGGHAHNLQQFKAIDPTGCRQFVSGASGRALYAEIPNDPRLEWGDANGFGGLRLELGDTLGVEWITEGGQVIYKTTITP